MRLTRRQLLGGALAGGALALGGLGAGWAEAAWGLNIAHWRPEPPDWPQDLPLRIVVLADLHAAPPQVDLDRVAGLVATANALGGDLIALMGDHLGSHPFVTGRYQPADVVARLADLRAPLGVWGVVGNHDWKSDWEAMRARSPTCLWHRLLPEAGIEVLGNRAAPLRHRGRRIWLAGLESRLAYWPVGKGGAHDPARALAPLAGDDAPAILLAHEPDLFARLPERVALMIAGHTHGGQARILGRSPLAPGRYGQRYAYGLVAEGRRRLVVSGGIGCSTLPLRLNMPPELTVIDLGPPRQGSERV